MRKRLAVAGLMCAGLAVFAVAGVFRAEPTIASEEGAWVTSEPQSEVDTFLAAVERVSPVVVAPFGPDGGVTSDEVGRSFSVPTNAPVRRYRFFDGRQYDGGTDLAGRGVPELVYSNTVTLRRALRRFDLATAWFTPVLRHDGDRRKTAYRQFS